MDAATSKPDSGHILPAFCQARMVLWIVLLAEAVAILMALAPGVSEDRWLRLGLSSLFVQWVALLTAGLLCLLQKWLGRLPPRTLALTMLVILFGSTLLVSSVAYSTLTQVGWEPQTNPSLFTIHNLAIAAVVGSIGILIFSLHLERSQRLAAQSRAELDALQARIRPHFLFNSLNTIAGLIPSHPEEAENALLGLSSLFRAALHAGTQGTLPQEIELTQQYLALEQWRLGNRLRIEWDLPDPVPAVMLPTLTLQPLVENAIRHGIEPRRDGGTLRITLTDSRRSIVLLVENPLPETPSKHQGNGVAIANIRQRLELLYGDRARLTAGPIEGGYRAKLVIPKTPGESRFKEEGHARTDRR